MMPTVERAAPQPDPEGVFSPIINRPIQLTRERVEGMVFGIAVGDALGLPVETWSAERIASELGRVTELGPTHLNPFLKGKSLPLGTWSDDAQLTIAMFNAFADAGGYSLNAILDRHIEAFNDTTLGWGGSTIAGVRAVIEGGDPLAADFGRKLKSGTGNGIPMKVAGVATYLAATGRTVPDMIEIMKDICLLSHRTTVAAQAGLAHVAGLLYCLSSSAQDFSVQRFIEVVTAASRFGSSIFADFGPRDDLTQRLETLDFMRTRSPQEIIEAFGAGECYVFHSLPFSYAFFLRNPLQFDAVVDAISAGGDTDSNAALVAGLQGALLGKAYLPAELVEHLQGREQLQSACDRFCEAFGIV